MLPDFDDVKVFFEEAKCRANEVYNVVSDEVSSQINAYSKISQKRQIGIALRTLAAALVAGLITSHAPLAISISTIVFVSMGAFFYQTDQIGIRAKTGGFLDKMWRAVK